MVKGTFGYTSAHQSDLAAEPTRPSENWESNEAQIQPQTITSVLIPQ